MNAAELRRMLTEFFNESELRDLCFDLSVDYEGLPGEGKNDKARELIAHFKRRALLSELVDACVQLRSHVSWSDALEPSAEIVAPSVPPVPDPRANPFTYGNPITDPARFFGRRREIEQVFSRLRNPEAESSSLVGERRIGKTSLLHHLGHPQVRRSHGLDPDRFTFIYVDLQIVDESITPERLWQRLLRQMFQGCQEPDVKNAVKEVQDAGTIDNFALADLFDAIDSRGQHIVFLLDEFENITENVNFGTGFFYGLRSLAIQHNLSLITSSCRELIELCHSEAIRSSPFFNIFANISVGLFSEAEARELIDTSLGGTNVAFTDAEIDAIHRIAGTYPFFLQAACHFLFEATIDGLGSEERVAFMIKEFGREAGPHLAHYWHDSPDQEKIVLTALALLVRQSEARQRVFSPGRLKELYTRAEQAWSRLEKRGLLVAHPDGYALVNTTFGDWIIAELTANGDPFDYKARRQSKRSVLEHLPTRKREELDTILPRISDPYRDLIVAWVSTPSDISAISEMLRSVLG